ncbi:MAG: hypothetical protein Q8L78_03160 [Coxiellaceae bacterium]|nr:hypothetical protein [Coxiellaceae bacterium]
MRKSAAAVVSEAVSSSLDYLMSIIDDDDRSFSKKTTEELFLLLETIETEMTRCASRAEKAQENAIELWKNFSEQNPDARQTGMAKLQHINKSIQDQQRNAQSYLHELTRLIEEKTQINHELSLRKMIQALEIKMIDHKNALREMEEAALNSKKTALDVQKSRVESELSTFQIYTNEVLSERSKLAQELSKASCQKKSALLNTETTTLFTEETTRTHTKLSSHYKTLHTLFGTAHQEKLVLLDEMKQMALDELAIEEKEEFALI